MENGKIDAIYFTLRRKPWCLAVRRKLQPGRDDFEFLEASSLPNLLVELLTILSSVHPEFIARLETLDLERIKKSSHRIVRYFDADYAPEWRKCLPETIGTFEAAEIAALACNAAGVRHKSISERLISVLRD